MKTFNMVKNNYKTFEIASDRGLVLQFFEAPMKLAPGVLCIFFDGFLPGAFYHLGHLVFV